MKKIFILPILIAPIIAHATDPVGPAAVGQGKTPVIATASAPYATATAETGDSTTVVSASYVKGAYNDAIAAVNKVNADKQGKLQNASNNHTISSNVVAGSDIGVFVESALVPGIDTSTYNSAKSEIAQDMGVQNLDDALISAGVVLDGFNVMGNTKQPTLKNYESDDDMSNLVMSVDNLSNASFTNVNNYNTFRNVVSEDFGDLDNTLMSSDSVITLIKTAVDEVQSTNNSKRISAVTTWGDDAHPTQLQLTTASN